MEALSANGNAERAELLKQHADEEVCALVLSLIDKVGGALARAADVQDHG